MDIFLALCYNQDNITYQPYWNSLEKILSTCTVYMYMSPSSGWSQFVTSLLKGSVWRDVSVFFDTISSSRVTIVQGTEVRARQMEVPLPRRCSQWHQPLPQAEAASGSTSTVLNTSHYSRFRFATGSLARRQLKVGKKASVGPVLATGTLLTVPQQQKYRGMARR